MYKANELIFNSEEVFFTSDTHFKHKNIIDYSNRLFNTIEEMEEVFINNWNKVIPIDAIVFHAGDFAFTGNIEIIKNLISRLNGKIFLALGNHDYQNNYDRLSIRELFYAVHDIYNIQVEDDELEQNQFITICHYPMLAWSKSHMGSWQAFGHLHLSKTTTSNEGWVRNHLRATSYDVGVDNNNYTPVSYQQLKTIITRQCLKAQ